MKENFLQTKFYFTILFNQIGTKKVFVNNTIDLTENVQQYTYVLLIPTFVF